MVKKFKMLRTISLIGMAIFLINSLIAAVAENIWFVPFAVIGWIVFFIAMISIHYGIKCPSCKKNLGLFLTMLVFPIGYGWQIGQFKFCPNCCYELQPKEVNES